MVDLPPFEQLPRGRKAGGEAGAEPLPDEVLEEAGRFLALARTPA